jgi:hypothetical protein
MERNDTRDGLWTPMWLSGRAGPWDFEMPRSGLDLVVCGLGVCRMPPWGGSQRGFRTQGDRGERVDVRPVQGLSCSV